MQRAAIAILAAAIFAASINVSHSKVNIARKPAPAELELLFGAIRSEPQEQKASEQELQSTLASMEDICTTIEAAAAAHELPVSFFARLIWQESRFRPYAVSPVGAQGIAQFMPATARERGLINPLDPIAALNKSAGFLRDLHDQFGNLGLAAAAYNGGPGRVQAWLKGRGGLPTETRQYVRIVTGAPADQWRGKGITATQTNRIPPQVPCPELVAMALAEEKVDVTGSVRLAAAEVQRTAKDKASSGRAPHSAKFSAKKAQRKFRSVLKGRKPTGASGHVARRGKLQVRI